VTSFILITVRQLQLHRAQKDIHGYSSQSQESFM